MTRADLTDLLERLTAATEGSPDLDELCMDAVYQELRQKYGSYALLPDGSPTRDTQHALDHMVPSGWHLEDMHTGDPSLTIQKLPSVSLVPDNGNSEAHHMRFQAAAAPILALAICIARVMQLIEASDG